VLRNEIEGIRAGDIACNVEEYTEGICALSVTFTDPLGRAFAISVPVPSPRFARKREDIEVALRNCREQIASGLGNSSNS